MARNQSDFAINSPEDFPSLESVKEKSGKAQERSQDPKEHSNAKSINLTVETQRHKVELDADGKLVPNDTSITQMTESDTTYPPPKPDPFTMLGLLDVINMTSNDKTMLALGTDLTSLGLNLNSSDSLYVSFASPWAESASQRSDPPEFTMPACYQTMAQPQGAESAPPSQNPHSAQHALAKMSMFSDETLLYIFYTFPRDRLQLAAAAELYNRNWLFHKEMKVWFSRAPNPPSLLKTHTYERGSFVLFDSSQWCKVRKDNFMLTESQIAPDPHSLMQHLHDGPSPTASTAAAGLKLHLGNGSGNGGGGGGSGERGFQGRGGPPPPQPHTTHSHLMPHMAMGPSTSHTHSSHAPHPPLQSQSQSLPPTRDIASLLLSQGRSHRGEN